MATDSVQTNTNWNFGALLAQGVLVNARYQLVSVRVVMPFLYVAIGAPVIFAGLLLPLAQISILLSQLAVAPLLDRTALRKWYIALALVIMVAALAVIALAVHNRISADLAALFLLLAVVLGMCRGITGLAFQDLVGRTLPRERRGKLLFFQSSLAGLAAIVIALLSQYIVDQPNSLAAHLELIWIGAALLVLALFAVVCIREPKGVAVAASGSSRRKSTTFRRGMAKELLAQAKTALAIDWFRRYLMARNLLLSVELAIPFYAMHAATLHADKHTSLNNFIIGSSIGLIAGGLFWERIGRVSVPAVMALASVTACAAGGLAIFLEWNPDINSVLLYSTVFLLVGVAAQGARISRRLYIVNATTDAERPSFIAVANTFCAISGAAVAFALGVVAHYQHVSWPIWCLVALNVAAALYAMRLGQAPIPREAT